MWQDTLREQLNERYVGKKIKPGLDPDKVKMTKAYKGYIDFSTLEDGSGVIDVCIREKRYGDYGEERLWTASHVLNISIEDDVITDIDIDDRVTGDDGLGDYDPAEVFSYDSYFTQSYVFMNKITE